MMNQTLVFISSGEITPLMVVITQMIVGAVVGGLFGRRMQKGGWAMSFTLGALGGLLLGYFAQNIIPIPTVSQYITVGDALHLSGLLLSAIIGGIGLVFIVKGLTK